MGKEEERNRSRWEGSCIFKELEEPSRPGAILSKMRELRLPRTFVSALDAMIICY